MLDRPVHHHRPIWAEACIGMQQQQPGSRCGGNAACQLLSPPGGAVQHLRASQLRQQGCAVAAAAITHHQLRDQIGRRLGRSLSAVKSLLFRARESLRAALVELNARAAAAATAQAEPARHFARDCQVVAAA